LDPEQIRHRNEAFAPPPDLLILLDIPPEQGLERLQRDRNPDNFEQLEYLQQVAAQFARMAFAYLRHIPATLTAEVVHDRIWQEVRIVLAQSSSHAGLNRGHAS
jgi:thymidylate kinase